MMVRLRQIADLITQNWARAGLRLRLLIGALLVAAIGLAGLTPNSVFSLNVSWPYAAFIAAAGWGRSGLAFAPMLVLLAFGFVQDETTFAPLGMFGLLNIIILGFSAWLHQTFDTERSPILSYGLPILVIVSGFIMLWIFASIVSSHPVRIVPILGALLSTICVHMIAAPVFDLGLRHQSTGQGATN